MKYNKNLGEIYKSPIPPVQIKTTDSLITWFDNLTVNPLLSYFTIEDFMKLEAIAMSIKLNSYPKEKFQQIGDIMKSRGFSFIGGGTNRRVYGCDYDSRVIAKIAINKVGITCNRRDFANQHVLKPFMYKLFDVSFNGVLALCEQVYPIHNLEEFLEIANEVYSILQFKIRMNNIAADDIGARSFKNWGIRTGFGPVLIDCPSMYVADKKKCFCNARDQYGRLCNAPLDYDEGFDRIVCTQCGKRYLIKSIAKTNGDDISELLTAAGRLKNVKGEMNMKIAYKNDKGNEVTVDFNTGSSNYIVQPRPNEIIATPTKLKVVISGPEKERELTLEEKRDKYVEEHPEILECTTFEKMTKFLIEHPEYGDLIPKDEEDDDYKKEEDEIVDSEEEETTDETEKEEVKEEESGNNMDAFE
jgi:DNA-directed RNA polymerase subunit RPC12/RpoP